MEYDEETTSIGIRSEEKRHKRETKEKQYKRPRSARSTSVIEYSYLET